jgi:long-chain acyl-CoA synthetase
MAHIDTVFRPWANSHPTHIALRDAHQSVTYAELDTALDGLVMHLRELGIGPGDRVLLVAENCVAQALMILAVSRVGAWSASVNARLSPREIANFVAHSGARRVFYFHQDSPEAAEHAVAHGAETAAWPQIGSLLVGPLNADTAVEPPEPDVAALVYTSGTTGASKAVMLTHANLLFIAANSRRVRTLVPNDVIYGVLPLSHVYGLSALLLAALVSGAELRLVPRFRPEHLAAALANEGITVLHGAPAMYAKLLALGNARPDVLRAPQLRIAQSGGAPLTMSIKENFEHRFGVVLNNGYGMTEAAPSICQTRSEAPRTDCSVGTPIDGIEVRLDGATLHPDGVGELQLRGPNVMAGYYRAPALTAQVITPDGWLCTGDLARFEADGAVTIVGRSKELIIRSGFNVYPVEIEQVLNAHPDIVQSAVIGRTVDDNEEVLAFVEMRDGKHLDQVALLRYLKANLSPYKIPAQVIALASLPAAASGKILKRELHVLAEAQVITGD